MQACTIGVMDAEITLRAARGELDAWAHLRELVDGSRDETVRRALAAGVGKAEIARRTGCSRSTIDRIQLATETMAALQAELGGDWRDGGTPP